MVEMKVQLSCQWQFPSGKLFRSLIPFLYTSLFRLNFRSHFLSCAKLQQVKDLTTEIQKKFNFKTTHFYFVYFVIQYIKVIPNPKIFMIIKQVLPLSWPQWNDKCSGDEWDVTVTDPLYFITEKLHILYNWK